MSGPTLNEAMAAVGWTKEPGKFGVYLIRRADGSVVHEAARAGDVWAALLKVCPACSREFSLAAWHDLPHVGTQTTEDEVRTYETDMRNCPCGSTIAVEHVATTEAPYVLP